MTQRVESLEAELAAIRNTGPESPPPSCERSAAYCEARSGGLYAGFEFVFAKPHFKESFQATVADGSGTLHLVPFSNDYELTPRAWFGYTRADGLGIRARYWQFDHAADPFESDPFTAAQAQVVTVVFPAMISATPPTEILNIGNVLEVHTVDLEGTQEINIGRFIFIGSGGVRYAMMRQQTHATVTAAGVVEQSLDWQRRFEGLGPVVSVEVERPLGDCGLAIIGAFRGSLLFGHKDLDRVEVNGIGGGPPVVSLDQASEVLGIGEVELGLQWTRQLDNGGSLFLRGTYEGQLWSDSGTPTLGYLGFQAFGVGVGFSR